jgi:multicomponent Na+:H+ antiporter subunit F
MDYTGAGIMIQTVAFCCLFILVGCVIASFYRVAKGPSLADRTIASDNIVMNIVGIVVLYSIFLKTIYYFDLVLVFSLLGFVGMVCFAKFLDGGRIID